MYLLMIAHVSTIEKQMFALGSAFSSDLDLRQ
jgi:hypothetical protein